MRRLAVSTFALISTTASVRADTPTSDDLAASDPARARCFYWEIPGVVSRGNSDALPTTIRHSQCCSEDEIERWRMKLRQVGEAGLYGNGDIPQDQSTSAVGPQGGPQTLAIPGSWIFGFTEQDVERANRPECWTFGHWTDEFFNPINCCHRSLPNVHIAVVGFPKAATWTMVETLGSHPEISADPEHEDNVGASLAFPLSNIIERNMEMSLLQRSKPGAWLNLIKDPNVIYSHKAMWILAQIPALKVLVMVREPTQILVSLYNYFVENCRRNVTADPLLSDVVCCRRHKHDHDHAQIGRVWHRPCRVHFRPNETSLWRDVVEKGGKFSKYNWDVGMVLQADRIRDSLVPYFEYRNMAFFDAGALVDRPSTVARRLQRLALFLGVRKQFDEESLLDSLRQAQKSGGRWHERRRVKYARERLCPPGKKDRQLADSYFIEERNKLWQLLGWLQQRGSLVIRSERLRQVPCGDASMTVFASQSVRRAEGCGVNPNCFSSAATSE